MEQLVKVEKTFPDATAQVVLIRQSACSGQCHQCGGECTAAQQSIRLTAKNPIGAMPGDLVEITSPSAPVLKGAAVLYMLPLVLFVGLYLLGEHLWSKGPLLGAFGFLMGLAGAVFYDRRMAKKNTEYTIIRKRG